MSDLKSKLWKKLAKKYRKRLFHIADQIEVDMFVSSALGEDGAIKRQALTIKELRAEVERLRARFCEYCLHGAPCSNGLTFCSLDIHKRNECISNDKKLFQDQALALAETETEWKT